MDIPTIMAEIKSPALREVVKDLGSIVERVKGGNIPYQQGSVEITGCKHVIQSLALDWAFSRRAIRSADKVLTSQQ